MIVDDTDIFGTCIIPRKAYSPLIVDTNAELFCSIASEGLQPIARRHAKI